MPKAGYTASKGVSNATFWVTVAGLLLVFGGASIVTGIRPHIGVGALVIFLYPGYVDYAQLLGSDRHASHDRVPLLHGQRRATWLSTDVRGNPPTWVISLDKWVISSAGMFPGLRKEGCGPT